jgi:hypothetical protein
MAAKYLVEVADRSEAGNGEMENITEYQRED